MNIVILQGSPNRDGSTAILCEEFARGARQAGHTVERIDVAHEDVRPCTGCVACGYGARPCVRRGGCEAFFSPWRGTQTAGRSMPWRLTTTRWSATSACAMRAACSGAAAARRP